MTESVQNAEHVENAAHVEHTGTAQNVISAEHIGMVKGIEVMSDKTKRRQLTRDVLFAIVVLISLTQSLYVGIVKNTVVNDTGRLIRVNTERNLCAGRYQDAVDAAEGARSSAIGRLIVIITQIPPGPEREAAVGSTIVELDTANTASDTAVTAKAAYNEAGRPLPCPLES